MRRRKLAGLLAVMLLSGGAAARPAGPAAPMEVVALVDDGTHDRGRLARSDPGMMADSTGVLAELRRTPRRSMSVSGPVARDLAKQPQAHGSLFVVVPLILLAIGVAVHAWHDSVMNNRTL